MNIYIYIYKIYIESTSSLPRLCHYLHGSGFSQTVAVDATYVAITRFCYGSSLVPQKMKDATETVLGQALDLKKAHFRRL